MIAPHSRGTCDTPDAGECQMKMLLLVQRLRDLALVDWNQFSIDAISQWATHT